MLNQFFFNNLIMNTFIKHHKTLCSQTEKRTSETMFNLLHWQHKIRKRWKPEAQKDF